MSQQMIEEALVACVADDQSMQEALARRQQRIIGRIANTLPRSISDLECQAIISMFEDDIYSVLEEIADMATVAPAAKLASLFNELPKSDQKALGRILGKLFIEIEELPFAA